MSTRPAYGASGRPSLFHFLRSDVVVAERATADIVLSGEIDLANCAHIPVDVAQLCRAGFRHIRLDMHAVTFIDCMAAHAFVEALDRARARGGTVVLTRVRGEPMRLLRLLELDTVLLGAEARG